ncbi:MAG TPA: hypothetical protein VHG70_15015 [Nocardioidaceae bacterium]|nr:hypothetical protein [Nocardioidaceae bacterium]
MPPTEPRRRTAPRVVPVAAFSRIAGGGACTPGDARHGLDGAPDPGKLRERDFSRGDAGSIFWYDIVAPAAVMVLFVIT